MKINEFFMSKAKTENRAHLHVRLARGIGRLRKRRYGHKAAPAAKGNIGADEKISRSFLVLPIRENKFVQQLDAGGKTRRNFVAHAEGLLQFTFALLPFIAFPDCFERRVVSENEW